MKSTKLEYAVAGDLIDLPNQPDTANQFWILHAYQDSEGLNYKLIGRRTDGQVNHQGFTYITLHRDTTDPSTGQIYKGDWGGAKNERIVGHLSLEEMWRNGSLPPREAFQRALATTDVEIPQ